jgi:hypothetical protein
MKRIFYIAATIYRLYEKQGTGISHFRMIATVILLLMLHLTYIGLIFDLPSHWVFPWSSESTTAIQWLNGGVYFGFLFIIGHLIFSRKKIDAIAVSEKSINRAKIVLPVYFVLSILVMGVLLIKRGIDMGKINW